MAKTINKENRKTLFTLSRSQQIMLGVFLVLISIIIFASLLSYFNSWRADQSEIESFFNKEAETINIAKKFGALISHFLIYKTFGILTTHVYCTKIASRLVRTYTDKHGLKNLLQELLDTDISKQQQSSDWGSNTLSKAQIEYAASDVLFLHKLKDILDQKIKREGRMKIAQSCFDFLPVRAQLDIEGWPETDVFAHS